MNLLDQVNTFDKTIKKRLYLKGQHEEFDTYRIPLDLLRYNRKNDRIATFITQYNDESGELPDDIKEFNNIIEEFIIESNPDAFNKTKNNIKAIGQTEPAVILSDGVVIDGNRRFTTLRQLYREVPTGKNQFGYLEAVILSADTYTDKDIKRLELNLQHAVESKIDYNPIERLVGIYRDLISENAPFTVGEYADETQISVRKINEEIEIAKLLVEYLRYINQPGKFHIARKQKIDGPLREISKILKSKKIQESDKDYVKELLFSSLLTLDGDLTREIRKLRPIMEDKTRLDEMLDDLENIIDDIDDQIGNEEVIKEASASGIINIDDELRFQYQSVTERFIDDERLSNAKNQPIESLKKSLERIEKVDMDAVYRFDDEMYDEFSNYLEKIEIELQKLKGAINA